jgi:hypothetical protein
VTGVQAPAEELILETYFAMQRANGDWFALDDDGAFRIPLFQNFSEAMFARQTGAGMLLFKPVALDENAVRALTPKTGDAPMHFWLVASPAANLKRGLRVEHDQLMTKMNSRMEK